MVLLRFLQHIALLIGVLASVVRTDSGNSKRQKRQQQSELDASTGNCCNSLKQTPKWLEQYQQIIPARQQHSDISAAAEEINYVQFHSDDHKREWVLLGRVPAVYAELYLKNRMRKNALKCQQNAAPVTNEKSLSANSN